jgi:hypothetical protein
MSEPHKPLSEVIKEMDKLIDKMKSWGWNK